MIERIMRAISFKTEVYPEVSKDETFTTSAWIIVAVVALISQIGSRAVLNSHQFLWLFAGGHLRRCAYGGRFRPERIRDQVACECIV